MVEVTAVLPARPAADLHRLESGRLRPTHANELSHALVSALTGRLRDYTAVLTRDVWQLEQRVTGGHLGDAEQFLDEMFRARHGLLTVTTMAANLPRFVPLSAATTASRRHPLRGGRGAGDRNRRMMIASCRS